MVQTFLKSELHYGWKRLCSAKPIINSIMSPSAHPADKYMHETTNWSITFNHSTSTKTVCCNPNRPFDTLDYETLTSSFRALLVHSTGLNSGLMGRQLCLMVSLLTTALMALSQTWCNLVSYEAIIPCLVMRTVR